MKHLEIYKALSKVKRDEPDKMVLEVMKALRPFNLTEGQEVEISKAFFLDTKKRI